MLRSRQGGQVAGGWGETEIFISLAGLVVLEDLVGFLDLCEDPLSVRVCRVLVGVIPWIQGEGRRGGSAWELRNGVKLGRKEEESAGGRGLPPSRWRARAGERRGKWKGVGGDIGMREWCFVFIHEGHLLVRLFNLGWRCAMLDAEDLVRVILLARCPSGHAQLI